MSDGTSAAPPARKKGSWSAYVQNTILAGLLAAVPLVVTWFVLQFLFGVTASVGRPAIDFTARRIVAPYSPDAASLLTRPVVENTLAVIVVVIGLFILGVLTRQVIGRRLAALLHFIVDRVPLANKIYGATKQLIDSLQTKPGGRDRIVLIDFPSPEMKAVGIVTRVMTDRATGEEIAAVFVPTTPNPTNGYLEVVPVSRLTPTTMSLDDAMSFVISGGAVGPSEIDFQQKPTGSR